MIYIVSWALIALSGSLCALLVLGIFYAYFWRRFHWLAEMKTWISEPQYKEWPEIVIRLERGEGTLLQFQGRHFWMLHWHEQRLEKCEAIEDRITDKDCFYTAQPFGYESMFVLRRRFPGVPIYCIRADYRGSFG